MKRFLSLLFVLVLSLPFFSFAGCGTGTVDYDPDNFIADTSNPQIVKEKITIKMFVPKASIQGQWEDMFIFRYMEELTNIHVEFEEVMLSSYSEKRGLRWESKKDPTDAFMLGNNADEVTQASALGALTPLNDPEATDGYSGNYGSLIDNYMPNYKKWLEKYDEIELATTQADGNIYSFSSVSTLYGGFATQYLNKKWLEKTDWYAQNSRLPETIEELEIVLTEFSEKDMNGNGDRNDEIPLSYYTTDETKNFLMSAFGFVGTGVEVDTREKIWDGTAWVSNPTYDQVVWVPATDAYRTYLTTLRRWYENGLIDPNIYENDAQDLAAKGYAERLGCFSSAGAFLVVGEDLASDYVAIGPLTSSVSQTKMWYQYSSQFDPTIMVIPQTTPYKREIARWLDFFYDEANVALQSYGEEGVHWDWDLREDGTKGDGSIETDTWHFNVPEGMERETYRATLTYSAGLGGRILETEWNMRESTPIQAQVFKDRQTYVDYLKPSLPPLIYTSEQMTLITEVETAIGTVMSNSTAYFITDVNNSKGEYDPNKDADWESFVSKMKNAGNSTIRGYEALCEQYQAAYDTYLQKRAAMQQ